MKLAKFIIFLVAVNSVSPVSNVTNSKLTPDSTGDTSSLLDTTTESGAKSSDPKHTCPTCHSKLSDVSTKVPSEGSNAGSDAEMEVVSVNYNLLLTAENVQRLQQKLQNLQREFQISQREKAFLQNLHDDCTDVFSTKKPHPIRHTYDELDRLVTYYTVNHKMKAAVLTACKEVLGNIAQLGFNIIWDNCDSGALSLSDTLFYYFSFRDPRNKDNQVKFDSQRDITPADRQRNDLIKAALKTPHGTALPDELKALGFSWFPKAETKPAPKPNPTVLTASRSPNPDSEALKNKLSIKTAALDTANTRIAELEASLDATKIELAELKQKQQRCTCGAK